jgi:hypothetical protein
VLTMKVKHPSADGLNHRQLFYKWRYYSGALLISNVILLKDEMENYLIQSRSEYSIEEQLFALANKCDEIRIAVAFF